MHACQPYTLGISYRLMLLYSYVDVTHAKEVPQLPNRLGLPKQKSTEIAREIYPLPSSPLERFLQTRKYEVMIICMFVFIKATGY